LIAFIADDSPRNADLVNSRILRSVELLAEMPHVGRPGRIPGTRERIVGKTPYILVYRIDADEIRILRVLRGARKWPLSFK